MKQYYEQYMKQFYEQNSGMGMTMPGMAMGSLGALTAGRAPMGLLGMQRPGVAPPLALMGAPGSIPRPPLGYPPRPPLGVPPPLGSVPPMPPRPPGFPPMGGMPGMPQMPPVLLRCPSFYSLRVVRVGIARHVHVASMAPRATHRRDAPRRASHRLLVQYRLLRARCRDLPSPCQAFREGCRHRRRDRRRHALPNHSKFNTYSYRSSIRAMGCSVGAGVGGATHIASRTAAASVTATSSAAAGLHS